GESESSPHLTPLPHAGEGAQPDSDMTFSPAGPILETERLLLRVPQADDFERFAEMLAHPSSLHIGGPLLRHEAWRRFLQMPGAWGVQGFAMFSVMEKSSGRWMGQAGPWQ